ncbi:BTB/POZ domain-containing protein At2g13690-like [Aristolochia californica]|uniref:BTB/POZ domain-containing protein At2g13690-like n=1 Tax=Aristolochia californica TaxID=171875 RepID=UPI0035DA6C5A
MADSGDQRSFSHPKNPSFRRRLCCSFVAPQSPEYVPTKPRKHDTSTAISSKLHNSSSSFPNSPSPNPRMGLGFIDPRRILSPGRVSPIDSEPPLDPLPEISADVSQQLEPEPAPKFKSILPAKSVACSGSSLLVQMEVNSKDSLDVRLDLKGKDGGSLVLELESKVLRRNSSYFSAKIAETRPSPSYLIEVVDVGDLHVFRETIELMYEKDIVRKLMQLGVTRSIGILEVSSTIKFEKGVNSCLHYLEAVPWTESEEEKLKTLFTKCTFEKQKFRDMLARLYQEESASPPPLAVHLVQSVTCGADSNATKELKCLVKGLLSQSSVYQKDPAGLTKEAIYSTCSSCISLLVQYFREASDLTPKIAAATKDIRTPLIGRISKQVENLNWLLEILIDKQMGEEFVGLWANQKELVKMHEKSSPMVRYELSRVSGHVFIALGRGKLQCRGEERSGVLHSWFSPMLVDFGWLQRCSKGLDVRELEEAMGQALLTLPMKQQQSLFMEWFAWFSKNGTECPNLSRAFQIWWRRSFLRNTKMPQISTEHH